jgi:hypothetical protein
MTDLWASNSGRIVCPEHAGAYHEAHLRAHPRARRLTTPLDAWEKMTQADRDAWLAEMGAPMTCEVCHPFA